MNARAGCTVDRFFECSFFGRRAARAKGPVRRFLAARATGVESGPEASSSPARGDAALTKVFLSVLAFLRRYRQGICARCIAGKGIPCPGGTSRRV